MENKIFCIANTQITKIAAKEKISQIETGYKINHIENEQKEISKD